MTRSKTSVASAEEIENTFVGTIELVPEAGKHH